MTRFRYMPLAVAGLRLLQVRDQRQQVLLQRRRPRNSPCRSCNGRCRPCRRGSAPGRPWRSSRRRPRPGSPCRPSGSASGRGDPRIWPSWPTTRMASGLAITTSKLISPAFTFAARSSRPTMSAPAALASSWFLPEVNTATRTVLPVPCGITVEPRTCWSDLLASMPRFTATSTDSVNLAVANSLTSFSASSIGYCLPGMSLSFQALTRFATGHAQTPSTSTPMLRALPAMVRTAASRSAAVRSGSWSWRFPRAACA